MRFGLLYSLQSRPDKPATQAQIYREMLEEIEAGEGLGFDSAWLVEHHFLADGLCPSPLVAAAAMAARTRRMTIGTSMYLLPLHRPVQSAEDVAVLDNLANGRIILGVAAGYRPAITKFPRPRSRPSRCRSRGRRSGSALRRGAESGAQHNGPTRWSLRPAIISPSSSSTSRCTVSTCSASASIRRASR